MTERASSDEGETMVGMDHSKMQMAESSGKHRQRRSAHSKAGTKSKGAGHRGDDHDMEGMAMVHGGAMQASVTRPQLVTMTLFTLLMLVAGMTLPAAFVNLRLSAHDVRGAIMPPGMIMTQETPAAAILDMAAVDPRDITVTYGLDKQGAQPLVPRIENGVKVFELETSVIRWQIQPNVSVDAYAFNGQVPGRHCAFARGDRVRINVTNRLSETTTVHWHGLVLPNVMDGPAKIRQRPIERGQAYRYKSAAVQSGSFLYHSHDHVARQQALGLYGALIIEPANPADEIPADHEYTIHLQEWLIREGLTCPAMPLDGGQPNYFTINGRKILLEPTTTNGPPWMCIRWMRFLRPDMNQNEGRRNAERALFASKPTRSTLVPAGATT